MRVQTHAQRPLDPLATLEDDYGHAVLHLAWDRTHEGLRTLLFAFVELLPAEIPPPPDDGEQTFELGAGHVLHLRRLVIAAVDSLAWYLDCRRGEFALPDDNGALSPVTKQAVDVVLGEDPPWPSLSCASTNEATPFCPHDYETPRVHHLVARAAFPLDELWPARGLAQRATSWLEDRLHFSLQDYPEYWGSVHLVAPNPVYRQVAMRLVPSSTGDSVLVRFWPRVGRSLDGLEFHLSERENWGTREVRRVAVEAPVLRFDFGRPLARVRDAVVDSRRGVLAAMHQDAPFMRGVVSVSMDGKNTRIGALEPTPALLEGLPYVAPAAKQIRKGHLERRARIEASEKLEIFDGRPEALESLRGYLEGATRDLLIMDPQLRSIGELLAGLEWVTASVRVLTAAGLGVEDDSRLGQLAAEVDELADHTPPLRVEIRIISTEAAALFGQFLVRDGQAWMLNAPLHRLGEQGTLMIAAPRQSALGEAFERAWSDAQPLRGVDVTS